MDVAGGSSGPAGARAAGDLFVPVFARSGGVPGAAQNSGGGEAGAGLCAEPVVTLQKEGDRVTHIRIKCSCGQVIELACAY